MDKDPEALDDAADGVLNALVKFGRCTNMSLERLLALIRAATPRLKGRHPRASSVIARGMATQLMRAHLECGMPDMRGKTKRAQLVAGGVAVKQRSLRPRAKTCGDRWHVRYGNAKVTEGKEIIYYYILYIIYSYNIYIYI